MTLVIFIRAEEHHGIVASFNKKTGDPDQVLPIHFFTLKGACYWVFGLVINTFRHRQS